MSIHRYKRTHTCQRAIVPFRFLVFREWGEVKLSGGIFLFILYNIIILYNINRNQSDKISSIWFFAMARWHVGTKGWQGVSSQPFFNISRLFGKTLAGVLKFLYLCSVKWEKWRHRTLRIKIARFKSRFCAH